MRFPHALARERQLVKTGTAPLDRRARPRETGEAGRIIDALYRHLRPVIVRLCEEFVDQAPEMLLARADRAASDRERRDLVDAARTFRRIQAQAYVILKASLLGGIRQGQLREPADAASDTLVELSLKDDESLEEMIAVSRLVQRLEVGHDTALWELERRLRQAVAAGVPLAVDALLPSGLAEAWRRTLSDVDVWPREKQCLFEVFGDFLAPRLGELIATATQALEDSGFCGEPVRVAAADEMEREARPDPALDQMLAQTLAGLAGAGAAQAAAAAPVDERLTRWLAAAGERAPAGNSEARASLAAQLQMGSSLVDAVARDLRVPEPVRHRLEGLRAVAAAAALGDPEFLRRADHPLRQAIEGLHELAVSTAIGGGDVEAVAELATDLAAQWSRRLAGQLPDRQQPADADPQAQAAELAAAQAESAAMRNRRLVQQVKAQVREEIRRRIGGMRVPDGAREFLLHGFGPLMGMLLARHGAASAQWQAARRRLDRLVDQLRLQPLEPLEPDQRERLLESVEVDLLAAGMPPGRVRSLLDGLREAWALLDRQRDASGGAPLRKVVAQIASDGDGRRRLVEQIADIVREELAARFAGDEADHALQAVLGHGETRREERRRALLAVLLPGTWLRESSGGESRRWLRVRRLDLQRGVVELGLVDGSAGQDMALDALLEAIRDGRIAPLHVSAQDARRWRIVLEDLG